MILKITFAFLHFNFFSKFSVNLVYFRQRWIIYNFVHAKLVLHNRSHATAYECLLPKKKKKMQSRMNVRNMAFLAVAGARKKKVSKGARS